MDKEKMSEGVIRYFRGSARDFTPIAVSADFAALVCPVSLNEDEETFKVIAVPVPDAA